MKLTPQVLIEAPLIINPEHKPTLQLRSLGIPYVENLGIVGNTFEVIDLTDNELTELGNFPVLPNLKTILASNNNIYKVTDDNFASNLHNLKSLVLMDNNIPTFGSIAALTKTSKLETLILINNPITKLSNYRHFIIWLVPSLKVLDFKKIRASEVAKAHQLFGMDKENPNDLAKELLELTFTQSIQSSMNKEDRTMKNIGKSMTEDEKNTLVEKLKAATSLEEIERIESILKAGWSV